MGRRKRLVEMIMTRAEVHIEGLSLRGWGRTTIIERERPVTVEVRGALPGDDVLVEFRRVEQGGLEAEVIEFLKYGYPRITPRCPHTGLRCDKDTGCGGCTLQSISYDTQLALKGEILQRFLDKNGIDVKPQPVFGCQNQWFYRNKMELTFGPDGNFQLGVGMHPAGYQHEVILLKHCETLSPLIPELCQKTAQWARDLGVTYYVFKKNSGFLRLLTLREGKRTGDTMVMLTTSGDEIVELDNGTTRTAKELIDDYVQNVMNKLSKPVDTFYWTQVMVAKGMRTYMIDNLIFGPAVLKEIMHVPDADHSLRFEILPHAFFQPNTLQAEKLYDIVRRQAEPYMADNTPMLDLYCGTGTIALSFARHGHRAIAVDIEQQAIENAKANAEYNGLSDLVEFYAGDTADILKDLLDNNANFSDYLLVIDPPRRGLLPTAYKQIMRLGLKTIIYVSCNPETLCEDLAKFKADGYDIVNIQPVDMLPQTAHLETVVTLHKN